MSIFDKLKKSSKPSEHLNMPSVDGFSFNQLYKDYPNPAFQLDTNGELIRFNQSLVKMLGYSERDLLRYFNTYFLEENQYKRDNFFEDAMKGVAQSFQDTIRHAQDFQIEIDITYLPIIRNKEVVGLHGIIKDLSKDKRNEEELIKVKTNIELAESLAKLGRWDYDIQNDTISWSDQLLKILGITKIDFTPSLSKIIHFVHPEDKEFYRQTVQKAIERTEGFSIEYRYLINDTVVYVQEQARVILNKEHLPYRILGTIQDISDLKKNQHERIQNEKILNDIYNNLEAGIWAFSVEKGCFTVFSPGLEEISGYKATDIKDFSSWITIIHPDDKGKFIEEAKATTASGKTYHQDYRIIKKDGKVIWLNAQAIPQFDEKGNLVQIVGILTDITESKEAEATLRHIAYHDYLTNLPNKRMLDEKLIEMKTNTDSLPIALLHLNIDRFKSINELVGHANADRLLTLFVERINSILSTNTLFARISGDEFYILIWGYQEDNEPISLAVNVLNSLKRSFYTNNLELFITTSIGISLFPEETDFDHHLRKNASVALKRAKQKGRNSYEVFSPSTSIPNYKLYSVERDLWKSIEKRELFLEFQPRVNTDTGKIVSAEALVRWRHPEWGVISPKEFIPVAEENGFILEIGDWVLEQVSLFLRRWEQKGLDVVPISINISAQRFLRNDWVKFIKAVIDTQNIDPTLIELEITEKSLIYYSEEINSDLEYLKKLGVKVALDDFGTGYSSLSYLKDYPINTIKVDKSFIDNIDKDLSNKAILKALISLANELNKNIVAEGVETKEQLQFLKEHNCPEVQGYLFSKPLPENEFQLVLQDKNLLPIEELSVPFASPIENAIHLDYPLKSNMRLISSLNKKVDLGSAKVVINNITTEQLSFLSIINLPVRNDFIYRLTINILGHEISYNGFIITKREVDELYEYNLFFTIGEQEKMRLQRLLSILTRIVNKNPVLLQNNFVKRDVTKYLKD